MKKLKIIGLFCALLITLLPVSCEKDDSGASKSGAGIAKKVNFEGEKIIIAYPWTMEKPGSTTAADKTEALRKKVSKDFNADVEIKSYNGNYYSTQIINSILSGKPLGHILVCPGTYFADYLASNIFADLTEAIRDSGIDVSNPDKYNQIINQYSNINGKQYGIQAGSPGLTDIWVFNKRILSESGIDLYSIVKNNEWTFAKAEELGKKLTKRSGGETTLYGIGLQSAEGTAYSMAVANKGQIMKVDPKTQLPVICWTEPNTVEALNTLIKWCAKDKICSFSSGGAWTQGATDFANGKYAMMSCSIDYLSTFRDMPMKDDYGIVYPPKGPKSSEYLWSSSNAWFQFVPVTYQDKAKELMLLYDAMALTGKEFFAERMDTLVRDEESLNTLIAMQFDSEHIVLEPSTIFGISFAEPSFAMTIADTCKDTISLGAAMDSYTEQFQSLLNDKWKNNKFTGVK